MENARKLSKILNQSQPVKSISHHETEEQLLALAGMGCDEAQGYFFSRPISEEEILRYLLTEKEHQDRLLP